MDVLHAKNKIIFCDTIKVLTVKFKIKIFESWPALNS